MSNSTISTNDNGRLVSEALFGTSYPNEAIAWIAAILFSVTALIHLFQYFKNRAWYLYLLLIGIFIEVAAYWARLINIKDMDNKFFSFIWYLGIMLAPSFLAAGCYMTFGRIIYWVTPESRRGFRHLWIPARFIALFFIVCDVISFCLQGLALLIIFVQLDRNDGDIKADNDTVRAGYNLLKVGFVMQVCVFAVFALLALRFMFASKQWRFDWPEGGNSSWRKLAWTIALTSVLIALRAIYRTLEFTLHHGNNYFSRHEWCLYVFDTLFVLVVLVSFNVVHPGRYMPHDYCTFGHDFKTPGFKRTPMVKEVDSEMDSAGFSRISLVPEPLAPSGTTPALTGQRSASMNFHDPWSSRVNTPNRF